jgi:hypothetical protein
MGRSGLPAWGHGDRIERADSHCCTGTEFLDRFHLGSSALARAPLPARAPPVASAFRRKRHAHSYNSEMTVAQRQLRVRVLEALERRVKQFRPREELWPLRVPRVPISLADVIEDALPDDYRTFDVTTLRSRTLLRLDWDDDATWELWVIALPSKRKLYCDSDADESRILASGGRNEGDECDRAFLGLLSESAGQHFGIEMSGGAPTRVQSSIDDRAFLVGVFLELFEVTGTEQTVRDSLSDRMESTDFGQDVERWLELALRNRPTE